MELTKEQICDKIDKLTRELTTYQAMLDQINVQEESEFSRKIKSMIGGYYMRDFTDHRWYYHVDRVDNVKDSNIDGLCTKCECAAVSIPKDPKFGYRAYVDCVYISEYDIADYMQITKEEFGSAVDKFKNSL